MAFYNKLRILVVFTTLISGVTLAQNTSNELKNSPEIFGTIDLGVAHLRGSDNKITGIASGGANISRIGFRGTEQIEDSSLKVGYWLEMGMHPDTGDGVPNTKQLNFNRRSTLSLMGNFGELRIGRDDSVTFLSTLIFDPFLTNGVAGTKTFMMLGAPGTANSVGGAPIQISNTVSYFIPEKLIKGLSAQLQVASGEKTASPGESTKRRDYYGTRIGYKYNKFNSAIAVGRLYGDHKDNNLDIANLALSYDFTVVKPALLVAGEKRKNKKIIATQLGFTVPFLTSSVIKFSIAHYDKKELGFEHDDYQKVGLGYGYNFTNKKTQAYINVSSLINRKGSSEIISGVQGLTPQAVNKGKNSNGIQLGLRHFF